MSFRRSAERVREDARRRLLNRIRAHQRQLEHVFVDVLEARTRGELVRLYGEADRLISCANKTESRSDGPDGCQRCGP